LSNAFSDLVDDLETACRKLKLVHEDSESDSARRSFLIGDLYLNVFRLLFEALKWHAHWRNRFMATLRKSSAKDLNDVVKKFKTALERIRQEAEQGTQERVYNMGAISQEILAEVQKSNRIFDALEQRMLSYHEEIGQRPNVQFVAHLQLGINDLFQLHLGQGAVRTLRANGQAFLHGKLHLISGVWPSMVSSTVYFNESRPFDLWFQSP
jgi:hypothetical protein